MFVRVLNNLLKLYSIMVFGTKQELFFHGVVEIWVVVEDISGLKEESCEYASVKSLQSSAHDAPLCRK